MHLKHLAQEVVDLVRVDRNGREHRESMPRWLAELAIACIPTDEPEVAIAKIEPIYVNHTASYPIKLATPEQARYIALHLASYMPARLVA
jgi:hypothetical protein